MNFIHKIYIVCTCLGISNRNLKVCYSSAVYNFGDKYSLVSELTIVMRGGCQTPKFIQISTHTAVGLVHRTTSGFVEKSFLENGWNFSPLDFLHMFAFYGFIIHLYLGKCCLLGRSGLQQIPPLSGCGQPPSFL